MEIENCDRVRRQPFAIRVGNIRFNYICRFRQPVEPNAIVTFSFTNDHLQH